MYAFNVYVGYQIGTGPVLELGRLFRPVLELGQKQPRCGTVPAWGKNCDFDDVTTLVPHWDFPNRHCIYSAKRQSIFKLHTYVPSSVKSWGAPNWH